MLRYSKELEPKYRYRRARCRQKPRKLHVNEVPSPMNRSNQELPQERSPKRAWATSGNKCKWHLRHQTSRLWWKTKMFSKTIPNHMDGMLCRPHPDPDRFQRCLGNHLIESLARQHVPRKVSSPIRGTHRPIDEPAEKEDQCIPADAEP